MKTFGEACNSLIEFLKPIRENVHKDHFGTRQYFIELHTAIHQGFVDWCHIMGIKDSDEICRVRISMTDHMKTYDYPGYHRIECLHTHIPHKFNVRGVWRPPEF